jgi:hypothetical protein
MKIVTILKNFVTYLGDGAARIFSLDRNTPPKIGVQPFEGDIHKEDRQN